MPVYDAPANRRFPYDLGVMNVFTLTSSGVATAVSPGTLTGINGETATGSLAIAAGDSLLFLLPQTGVVKHIALLLRSTIFGTSGTYGTQTSPDSTDGVNGSWTQQFANTVGSMKTGLGATAPSSFYRTILGEGYAGSTSFHALKFTFPSAVTIHSLHLGANDTDESYGSGQKHVVWTPSPTNTTSAGINVTDYGDIPRAVTSGPVLASPYLRNSHNTLTANNIVLSFDSLTPAIGALAEHQVRIGGGAWSSSLTIASIAPVSSSALIETRRNVATNAVLGPWVYRLVASVGSWT